MSNPAKSVYFFGLYLLGLGAILLVIPNMLLAVFGLPPTGETWIRVAGMLVLFLGIYYAVLARGESTLFFRLTVYLRSSVIVFFTAFVLLSIASPPLILFGAVDLLGAIWTGLALRQSRPAS